MKNKIEFPDYESRDDEMKTFFENVKKSENLIKNYIANSDFLAVSTSNCQYGSVEDYIGFYARKNNCADEALFKDVEPFWDSPLERALYMASSQQVVFERGDEKFYFDYTYGPHSEYRIYELRRIEK